MAVFDALKTLKFNKSYKRVWDIVWAEVEEPPSVHSEVVTHLCFVGTLMYATRYQVGLSVGMSDTFAKSLAVLAIGKAGYDEEMEDMIYGVFSNEANERTQEYVSRLYATINQIINSSGKTSFFEGDQGVDIIQALRSQYERLDV